MVVSAGKVADLQRVGMLSSLGEFSIYEINCIIDRSILKKLFASNKIRCSHNGDNSNAMEIY